MWENCIRENIQANFIFIDHIKGEINLSDLFTKEEKHPNHFQTIRDKIMTPIPSTSTSEPAIQSAQPNNNIIIPTVGLCDKPMSTGKTQQNNIIPTATNNTVGKGGCY